jgi:hypothetical protein
VGRYDDLIKSLSQLEPASLCRLVGVPIDASSRVVRLSENLSTTTRQVDLLLAVDDRLVLHIEFQTKPERRFAQRMFGYLGRLREQARFDGIHIAQHAVLLGPGTLNHQIPEEDYSFTVHYLRNTPVGPLLDDISLTPFAVLADLHGDDHRVRILRVVLDRIAAVSDPATRRALAWAAADLATLCLATGIIETTWEESAMPFPSFAQALQDRALEEGREEGRLEQGRKILGSMLRQRFGPDPRIPAIARRLATLDPDECAARITAAVTLDELAQPGD